jgi:hypothetical protein
MLTKIKCPKCNTEGTFSLSDAFYEGPYRCWKCKALLKIRMEHNVLKSCEPISAEEMVKLEEIQSMRDKFRRGGNSG